MIADFIILSAKRRRITVTCFRCILHFVRQVIIVPAVNEIISHRRKKHLIPSQPHQYYIQKANEHQKFILSYLIDQTELLFWKKMYTSNNVTLYALSRFVINRFM